MTTRLTIFHSSHNLGSDFPLNPHQGILLSREGVSPHCDVVSGEWLERVEGVGQVD